MTYFCKLCDYSTLIKCNFGKHIQTKKHKDKELLDNINKININKNFICEKCNKQFSSKQWLENHMLHCRGVSSILECCKCNKIFKKSITRYKHEKNCKNNKLMLLDITPTNNNIISKNITNIINNNTINNITNNTINNMINNTINITINCVGDEKIDYLLESPDFIKFMDNCIKKKVDGICDLIVKKHFDPEHPENHNIRKMNKKDNFLEIYTNNNWNIKNYKDGLDFFTIPLETTCFMYLDKVFELEKEQKDNIKVNIIQHFMKEVGSIIGWDLSVGDYNFSFNNSNMQNDMSDKSKNMLKLKIYKIFCECIYNYSKIIHKI